MGEQTQATQTYVVQTRWGSQDEDGWRDIATVTVPSRTHRKTIIEKALEQAELAPAPGAEKMLVRVLDADSAKVSEVGSVQPPAQLVIGG